MERKKEIKLRAPTRESATKAIREEHHIDTDFPDEVRAAALTDTAQPLGAYTVTPKTVFVIGNEGHGLSEQTIAACCGSVIIPMAEGAESFNAAIAASILMWERTRI